MPFATLTIRKEPHYRRQAFLDGLRRLGYVVTMTNPMCSPNSEARPSMIPSSRDDLLVVWNLKQGFDEGHAEKFERRGGTVIVVENGYLQKYDKTMYAISVHGHNGSGWFPDEPAEDRFTRLEYPQQPWREYEPGSPIVVCGQRGIGSALMASPQGWGERTKVNIEQRFAVKGHPTRPIRLRPHPGNFVAKVPVVKDLHHAHACAIWSSAIGVQALTMGIPVFRGAPRWICKDVSSPLAGLTKEFTTPRHTFDAVRQSLRRMAHGQWSVDEIASGEPFARMKAHNWGPLWD